MAAQEFAKVTIYSKGEMFGTITAVEARTASIERRAYAQYQNAIEVKFVKKGARKTRGFVLTYRPHLLVLKGHGHPKPAGLFDGGVSNTSQDGQVTTHAAKHRAFDGGYGQDFDAMIAQHIETTGAEVLFDARGETIR